MENKDIINILLLGETGVGKSTFINAFINYTLHASLFTAEKNGIQCLIPSKFTITDEDYKQRVIEIGEDRNENTKTGESATQGAKSYFFQIKTENERFGIRLIDTPGIGDTRGPDQDDRNLENVLSYISQYEHLHAICILLKPNNARITPQFEFCLNKLFCQLEKSAGKNIIFVFTNTRGTFYRPGDTRPALEELLQRIADKPPHVHIRTEKNNMYCFDNEAFRFLAALKSGVKFTQGDKDNFAASWKQSSEECWRMLEYVRGKNGVGGLVAHKVQSTVSVNNARKIILQLSRPLADITQLISENLLLMERKKVELGRDDFNLAELKQKLFIPQTDVRLKELAQPVTVCAGPKCCRQLKVNGRNVSHYPQRCHNPCYLENVPKEIIGSPELVHCAAMGGSDVCRQCSCTYSFHMHIYYETEAFENNVEDVNVCRTITTKEQAVAHAKKLIQQMVSKGQAYEYEKEFIIKTLAKFSHFLANNAITPYNDAYKFYFSYLIDREKALGPDCDFDTVRNLQTMLARYDEEKRVLDETLSARNRIGIKDSDVVTADEVKNVMSKLYKLKNFGGKIKQAFEIQNRSQETEVKNNEYVHGNMLYKVANNPPQNQQGKFQNRQRGRGGKSRGSHQNNNNNRPPYNQPPQTPPAMYPPPPLMNMPGPPMGYQGSPMHPMYYQGPPMGYPQHPMGYQGYPQWNGQNYGPPTADFAAMNLREKSRESSDDTASVCSEDRRSNPGKKKAWKKQANAGGYKKAGNSSNEGGKLNDNTALISGLNSTVTKAELLLLFKEACELGEESLADVKVWIYKNKTGEGNGKASATFAKLETAKLVVALVDKKNGLSVRLAGKNDTVWTAGQEKLSVFPKEKVQQGNFLLEENTVVVSGLPSTVTKGEIAKLFEPVCEKSGGDTRRLKMWIYYKTSGSRIGNGKATVTCGDALEAKIAVGLLNGEKHKGELLEVRLAGKGETYWSAGQLSESNASSGGPTGRYMPMPRQANEARNEQVQKHNAQSSGAVKKPQKGVKKAPPPKSSSRRQSEDFEFEVVPNVRTPARRSPTPEDPASVFRRGIKAFFTALQK